MLTQDNRFLKIHSPLGENQLLLHRFSGTEAISRLFEFQLDLISEKPLIDFEDMLGKAVSVEMEGESSELPKPRFFHGYITGMRYVGELMADFGEVHGLYKATMRPWLWFLTRTTDCRIFQEKDVKTIIEEIFKDNGFTDYRFSLSERYKPMDYCVQYRETDFNFVSRLMEQEGMVYYFLHEKTKHTLVIGDSGTAHATNTSPYDEIDYILHEGGSAEKTGIHRWVFGQEILSGEEVVLDDYDFEKPKVDLTSKELTRFEKLGPGESEIYDYPGEYTNSEDGERYAKKRMEELESLSYRAQGGGDTRGLVSGCKFKLKEHPREDLKNIEYLVLTVTHDIQSDTGITTAAGGDEIYYSCQFKVMPLGYKKSPIVYTSPRITPKPIVQGPQTAVVVGKKGEEIWTDKYGRVKVQFHWDRKGEKDGKGENMTCFLRVATAWAGQNWGTIHIPRIGQEVVVSFLEGDPDRPLVTGSVYNANNMPPYTLPEHQTQSGIKSRSTKQGTDKNFNEIRFEDGKGEEELRVQAEKDMNIGVKQTRKTFIGSALQKKGTGDKHEDCPKVGTVIEQLTVFADRETFIKGNDTLQIAEDHDAKKGRCMTVHNGNHELTVSKGDQITKVKMGKISIEAATEIELKVGACSIKLTPAKIEIKGTMIEVNGSATTIVKGGTVLIN